MRVTGFESTPNPQAMKCILAATGEPTADSRVMRSYRAAADAVNDALASALFDVDGVTNVLIAGSWITVGKRPDADWKSIKPKMKRVIESHSGGVVRGT